MDDSTTRTGGELWCMLLLVLQLGHLEGWADVTVSRGSLAGDRNGWTGNCFSVAPAAFEPVGGRDDAGLQRWCQRTPEQTGWKRVIYPGQISVWSGVHLSPP